MGSRVDQEAKFVYQWLVGLPCPSHRIWKRKCGIWQGSQGAVDLSSARSRDIHLRAISQGVPLPSVTEISLKITYWSKITFRSPGPMRWIKIFINFFRKCIQNVIWVRSRNCGCLGTWFCYQLIAKPGNKTAVVSWPDPCTAIFSEVSRARRFPLPDGPGQVKLPVGQVDLDRFFLFISYKQIEEFQNSWSQGKWWFWEKSSPGQLIICLHNIFFTLQNIWHKNDWGKLWHSSIIISPIYNPQHWDGTIS